MVTQRPFLDYYATLGTTPVNQDISDLRQHLQRRTSLYQLLGIPPRFFASAEVLEFGPGLGHNALAVATLGPRRHVLVDGNPAGVAQLRGMLGEHFGGTERFEIVESLVEEYRSDGFDIVLAENLIPMQRDPKAFCRAIAAHVRPGGVLVVTCMTALSTMGETLRRAIALKIAPPSLGVDERVARLRELFAAHLAQLPGVSRPVEDWIKDNITHPLVGRFFSVADAIDAIGAEFDAYGGSPHFFTDWRWYKQVHGDARRFNERALEAYRAHLLNLVDWRLSGEPQPPASGVRLERLCDETFALVRAMEDDEETIDLEGLARACDRIAAELLPHSKRTAAAFDEVAAYLRSPRDEDPGRALHEFASFFGRGVQYVSFIRR